MELNDIYRELIRARLCKNGRDFSVRYLGKKKSYYSVIKARKLPPSTNALMHLYFKLNEQSELIPHDGSMTKQSSRNALLCLSKNVLSTVKAQLETS